MVLINLTKMAHNEDGAHHVQETRSVSQTRARHICVTLSYVAGQRAEFEAFETFSFKSSFATCRQLTFAQAAL